MLLARPPLSFDAETLRSVRFFVNDGEIYDFTYRDLVQNGDVLEYGLIEETPQSARLSVRLIAPVPGLTSPRKTELMQSNVPKSFPTPPIKVKVTPGKKEEDKKLQTVSSARATSSLPSHELKMEANSDKEVPSISVSAETKHLTIFLIAWNGSGKSSLLNKMAENLDGKVTQEANSEALEKVTVANTLVTVIAPTIQPGVPPETSAELDKPLVVLGNKCDDEGRQITSSTGTQFANDINSPYFDVSAKTGSMIKESLELLIERIIGRNSPQVESQLEQATSLKDALKKFSRSIKTSSSKATVPNIGMDPQKSPKTPKTHILRDDDQLSPHRLAPEDDPRPSDPKVDNPSVLVRSPSDPNVASKVPEVLKGDDSDPNIEAGKRKPMRRASTLDNNGRVRLAREAQKMKKNEKEREKYRSSLRLSVTADQEKEIVTVPKMDAYTASKKAAGINMAAIGGRDESFGNRCRRLRDLNSILEVFATVKHPRYKVRYSKVIRGDFLFPSSLDPFKLTDAELAKWSASRGTAKTNGVQLSKGKEVIGADFVGVIVDLILNPAMKKAAPKFFNTFVWTHDSYISRYSLLRLLCIYYRAPPLQGEEKNEMDEHVVDLICDWIALQFPVLREDSKWMKVFERFMTYLKSHSDSEESSGDEVGAVKNIAYHKQIKRAWKTAKVFYTEKILTSVIQKSGDQPHIEFVHVPAWSIAQQITFIDQSIIQSTPLQEFRIWADKQDVDRGKFADLQHWVATTILVSPGNAKERATILVHWVEVMEELQKMQNLHSLMAVYLGIKMQPVKLLTSVWHAVPKNVLKTIELLDQLFDVSNDFSNYRKFLDSINKQNPYIPVQTLPLLELAEVSQLKSLDEIPGELNWKKINKIGKVMEMLRLSRINSYKLEESPALQQFLLLQIRNVLTETELFAATALRDEKNGKGLMSPHRLFKRGSKKAKRASHKEKKLKISGDISSSPKK